MRTKVNRRADPISTESLGPVLRRARLEAGLTQAVLAQKLGVANASVVANWENGVARPTRANRSRLVAVLGLRESRDRGFEAPEDAAAAPAPYGDWLRRKRSEASLSVPELAKKAKVSVVAIYNIESGRSVNPQQATRETLESVLRTKPDRDIVELSEQDQTISGLGTLITFDPHDPNKWPTEPGVYVLYDIADHVMYVGKSSNSIADRLRKHSETKWYIPRIIHNGAYIAINDEKLCLQVEQVLIKFLRSNAVINDRSVEGR